MEDEKGLDLSLGLPCGGNTSSQKGKYGSSSSDIRSDEGDRGSKLINEFKNFLEGGSQQHPLKVGENFYNNFGKAPVDLETSKSSNTGGGIWLGNDSRSTEIEEEKKSNAGEKRKNLFTETNQQKKQHERETNHPDSTTDKAKTSHISITTDEGSTAENEDVADSEVDGSTSRQVSQHDEVSKHFGSSGVESLGQKRYTVSSEKEFNIVNMPPVTYGVQFQAQPANMNMPYSQPMKDLNMNMNIKPANFPLMFGYTPVQLPALDRDNSRSIVSHHQQILQTYPGKNSVNQDTHNDSRKLTQAIPHKSPEATQYDARAVEHGKSYGKQQVGEEGSSSHTEAVEFANTNTEGGDPKGNHAMHQAEPIPSEFPAIRPGVAADLKFGGCGSYPNLPWVSTTGSGPNGRTISGVTYRYSPTQIRIVCACHGSHLSPEEFVRHAAEENNTTDATGNGLTSLPSSNPAASAQS